VATLAGAGFRIGEATALDWRDVSLATGTLTVREAKTAAGAGREVDLPVGLREELATWRARSPRTGRAGPVFVSRPRSGRHARQTPRNVQAGIKTAVRAANRELAEAGLEPISESVTPHSLRRTYASLRAALRDDPVYIAEQLGHEDARFTFRVYQRAAKRRERLAGEHLAAFDRALDWAGMGREAAPETVPGAAVPTHAPADSALQS
jgi:integrase